MNMHILLSSVHFVLYRTLFAHPTLECTFCMNMAVFVRFSLGRIPYNRKFSHGAKFRGFGEQREGLDTLLWWCVYTELFIVL